MKTIGSLHVNKMIGFSVLGREILIEILEA